MRGYAIGWFVLILLAGGAVRAQTETGSTPTETAPAESRLILDSIREDLVQLRFEKALAAIEAVLGDSGLSEEDRAEAFVLRGQAHAAFGDLKATEEDYRAILKLRPGYEPDTSLTPRKAMDRFKKVRDEMVGRLRVEVTPAEAQLFVDDRPSILDEDGNIALLAGEHRLRASLDGFDTQEQTLQVEANQLGGVTLRLVPNARSVILRTEQDEVEVYLNGDLAGRTRVAENSLDGVAELLIENLPLQEHLFELKKECFRTERVRDQLSVDLLDFSAKRYKPVRLIRSESTLALEGGPPDATIHVDGRVVGRTPSDPLPICPGERTIEVHGRDRLIWRTTERFQEASEVRALVTPRPNVVIFGADGWPAPLESFGRSFNVLESAALPADRDLSSLEAWRRLGLPADADLALAVLPAERQGARDRWILYSPILRALTDLAAPPELPPISWTAVDWGLGVVDAGNLGRAVVVSVPEGRPAAAAGIAVGDRIFALGGREISDAADVQATLRAASVGRPLEIEWMPRDGERRQAALKGIAGPKLTTSHGSTLEAMVFAARALVDSICLPDQSSNALANLALVFSDYGHHELALGTWRRVRWGSRIGIGDGTAQYYIGKELEALGREKEAVEAYTRAAGSQAAVHADGGPAVAPAAADRLRDLGVVLEPTR